VIGQPLASAAEGEKWARIIRASGASVD